METLNLTPAELEMIRINRETEALEQQRKATEKALKLQKEIEAKQKQIQQDKTTDQEQIKAAQTFLADLGTHWLIKIKDREQLYTIEEYTNPNNPSSNGYERETVWKQTEIRQVAYIESTDAKYSINVVEHITYYSGYRGGIKSRAWKMQINGPGIDYKESNKYYTKGKTVNEKISAVRDQIRHEQEMKQKQATALETTVERLKSEYPTATITVGADWDELLKNAEYDYTRYNGKIGDRFDTVKIALTNGITVTYRVYVDGSMSRTEIIFPKSTAWEQLNVLSGIKFE